MRLALFSFLLGGAAFFVVSCRPAAQTATPDEVVSGFFGSYNGNFREADSAALSAGLREAIASAVSIEQKSRAAIAASPFPSDKPLLIEGEIFSGLYEGFTGFQAGRGETSGKVATVDIRFTNSHYSVGWTDRVQLVDENGWKIDDVRYLDKKAGVTGLRDVFADFEKAAARDPLLNPQGPGETAAP